MVEILKHDVVIVGSGLAGLRAAIEASRVSNGKLSVAVVTKTQVMRSHSVSAEGGTAAVLYTDEGDSFESHMYDTVKGSDFLADQDAVELFVYEAPKEILQLEHWGMPWSRREDGRIAQRYFGGMTYPRTCFAEDKVGFFEMSTLYDTCLRWDNITFYQEWFGVSVLVEDGRFRGITAIEMKTGDFYAIEAKSGIIATGGAGRLYSFATFGHSSTPDGLWMAYRAGAPLKDMEFVQFHPTGLIPSGILITEAARGEGGILLNAKEERFLKRYAPKKMELAPRDIISRAMYQEMLEGRGVEGPGGMKHLWLDLTVIEPERLKERLAGIREICLKLAGIDPINERIPVRPVAHYYMGGIHTDIRGATPIAGLWAAGEAACVTINGANRLGSNSTTECLVWGRITGAEAARFAMEHRGDGGIPVEQAEAEEKRIFDGMLGKAPRENPYEIKRRIQRIMDEHCYIYRDGPGLEEGLRKLREIRKEAFMGVEDTSRVYNTNLTNVLEIEAMLEISQAIMTAALHRTESRGAQYRTDYPKRDDERWLKHILLHYTVEGPEIGYAPVKITRFKPEERKY